MSFSTDMDKAIANMATARKAAVKSAFTTLDTALTDEETDYETRNPEKIATRDRLLKMARELAVRMQ